MSAISCSAGFKPAKLIQRVWSADWKSALLLLFKIPHTLNLVEITDVYNRAEALEVIRRSQQDYQTHFAS